MKKSLKRQDYHDYVWKRGERARTLFLCIGVTGVLSYFFYRSFLALLPLSVIGAAAFFLIRRQKLEKAKGEFEASQDNRMLSALKIYKDEGNVASYYEEIDKIISGKKDAYRELVGQ